MAYDLGTLVQEVLIFSVGRKSVQLCKDHSEYVCGLGIYWTLARCKLELCVVGTDFLRALTIERLGLGKLLAKTKVLKHIFLIPLTWVVFALPNMQDIGTYFSRLFPFFADNTASFVNTKDVIRALHDYWYLLIACVVFCLPFPSRWYEKHKNSKLVILGLVLIYLMSVYKMQTQTSNPFLYYQF